MSSESCFIKWHLILHVFVNFNGNKKDLCMLQRLFLTVPEEPLERYINLT